MIGPPPRPPTGPGRPPLRDALRGLAGFVAAARRSPREVGTVVPSGAALGRRLAEVLPRGPVGGRTPVVVEVGAGDGAVTRVLAEHVGPDVVLLAVEKDAGLAERLRARGLAGVEVVTADAADLGALLAERGLGRADAIVSVLPWTLFPLPLQRALLAALAGALRPDGVFTAVAYSSAYPTPPARRFRAELRRCFAEVLPTRTVWRNVPPAMTYVCRRPLPG